MRGEGLAKALMMVFALAYCWPFIAAVDSGGGLFQGVPVVLVYLFGGWVLLVAALAATSRRMKD